MLNIIEHSSSHGKVWIDSANPFIPPKFRFNYLCTDHENELAIAVFKATRELFQHTAWVDRQTSKLCGVNEIKSEYPESSQL